MPDFRIIWLRHGDATPSQGKQSDRDRKLTLEGKLAVRKTAAILKKQQWIPQVAFVSRSQRTQDSFEEFLATFATHLPVEIVETLYLGEWQDIKGVLESVREPKTVLLVGHNPGFSNSITYLTCHEVMLSPGEAACIEFSGETWEEALLSSGLWELKQVISRTTPG